MDLTEFRGVLAKIESIRRKARFNKPEDLDIDEIDPIWGWEKYDIRHCTQDLKYMKGMIQRSQDENVKKSIVDFIMAEIAIN
ncbi:MAG: hypothetical protein NT001_01510, partial [Candidatus Woesearchaeota archaeon]|nr:hypothetical protein [Candidatus Woesearchaeota archaeon]